MALRYFFAHSAGPCHSVMREFLVKKLCCYHMQLIFFKCEVDLFVRRLIGYCAINPDLLVD